MKPFLREMEQGARDDVLRDLSARLFGQPKIQVGGTDDVVLPPGTMQLIQMMVSAVRDRG